MAVVTVQVIQGLEAGAIYRDLQTPITIGREEENSVQLNDERISRFHAKIQADDTRLILTDLQSTNGTRVNGHFARMRTLQIGDLVAVGRCLLIVGSPEEVAALDYEIQIPAEEDSLQMTAESIIPAFPAGPPAVPKNLSALQCAEVASIVEHIRTEMLNVLVSGVDDPDEPETIHVHASAWHRLQSLPSDLARYLQSLNEAGSGT